MKEKKQSKLEQLADKYKISAIVSVVISVISFIGQTAAVNNLARETQRLTEHTTRYPSLNTPVDTASSIANMQQLILLLDVIVALAGIVFIVSILCYLFCGILKASKEN